MRIEDRGVIFDASRRSRSESVACFTSLCTTSSGAIISAFQVGPAKNAANSTLRLCRSRNQGRNWQELDSRFETTFNGVPGSITGGEMVEITPDRLLLIATWFDRSDPQRPLFDPATHGILPSKQLMAFSADDGDTWTSWSELRTDGLKGCSNTGPILKWRDGTIAYPFESYKEFNVATPATHGAWFMISRDGGLTFEKPVLVAQHPQHRLYYWDQRLCAGMNPGEFVGLFWTHDLENKRDLSVHVRKGSLLNNTFQDNPIAQTTIPGQIAAPLLLEDGRLLAFVVNRIQPANLTLWASSDGGATWPERLVVYVHDEQAVLTQNGENVDFAQYWEDMGKWSFGHPAIRSLGGGKVLLAYYAGTPDRMSIHWARVCLE